MQDLIAEMPPGRAAALMLTSREGWTYAMAADHLGCTSAHILTEVRAALSDLRSLLPRPDDTEPLPGTA